jgi:hypothetical protein
VQVVFQPHFRNWLMMLLHAAGGVWRSYRMMHMLGMKEQRMLAKLQNTICYFISNEVDSDDENDLEEMHCATGVDLKEIRRLLEFQVTLLEH